MRTSVEFFLPLLSILSFRNFMIPVCFPFFMILLLANFSLSSGISVEGFTRWPAPSRGSPPLSLPLFCFCYATFGHTVSRFPSLFVGHCRSRFSLSFGDNFPCFRFYVFFSFYSEAFLLSSFKVFPEISCSSLRLPFLLCFGNKPRRIFFFLFSLCSEL